MRRDHTDFIGFANRSVERCLGTFLSDLENDTEHCISNEDLNVWIDIVGEIVSQAEVRWKAADDVMRMANKEKYDLEVTILKARTILAKQMTKSNVETIKGHRFFAVLIHAPDRKSVRIGKTGHRGAKDPTATRHVEKFTRHKEKK